MPRVFLEHAFAPGEVLPLPAAQSRHVQVLRLQPGDAVALFNGADGLDWQAEITRIGRSEVEVRIVASTPAGRELPVAVTLALGVPANERMDTLVEKASELGVAAIQPLICERSVVRLAGDRAEARRRHWSAVAASASEQCGRARVPHIAVPAKLDAWLRQLDRANVLPDRPSRLLLSLAGDVLSPRDLPEASLDTGAGGLVVLSGPEGGLTPAEEEAAIAAGFVRLGLGPRTLRADTAPLAFLAWLGLALAGATA